MGYGIIHVDLPEACEPLPNFLAGENAAKSLTFDILVERNFGAGQQADRNVRLADSGEAASDGVAEFGGHQPVIDLGRPSRHKVQTIVTHGRISPLIVKSRNHYLCEAPAETICPPRERRSVPLSPGIYGRAFLSNRVPHRVTIRAALVLPAAARARGAQVQCELGFEADWPLAVA